MHCSKRGRSGDALPLSKWWKLSVDDLHAYIERRENLAERLGEKFMLERSFIHLVYAMLVYSVPEVLVRQVLEAMGVTEDASATAAIADPRAALASLDHKLLHNDSEAMTAWTASSRRALVALIVTYHDMRFADSIVLQDVVSLHEETTLRELFTKLADPEDISVRLEAKKLFARRTLSYAIEMHAQSRTLGNHKYWTFDNTVEDRHVRVDRLIDLDAWPTNAQLVVLSGESGSGKTTTALAHFLLNKKKDTGECAVLLFPTAPSDEAMAASNRDSTMRNNVVKATITRIVEGAVKSSFGKLEQMDGVAALIFDELGNARTFLRGLCAVLMEKEFVESLCQILSVSRIEVVACGTGVDVVQHGALELASSLASYHLINMSDEIDAASFRDQQLRRLSQHPTLEACIREHVTPELQTAWRVMHNRRAAALVVSEFQQLEGPAWTNKGVAVISARVAMIVQRAVERFRMLNSLRGLSDAQVSLCFAESLNLVMSRTARDVEGSELLLLTTYGLITDNVRLVASTVKVVAPSTNVNGDIVLSCVHDDANAGHYVLSVLPRTCNGRRYHMTEAVMEMGMHEFGFATRPQSGIGLKRTIVDHLFLYLLACAVDCRRIAPVEQTSGAGLAVLLNGLLTANDREMAKVRVAVGAVVEKTRVDADASRTGVEVSLLKATDPLRTDEDVVGYCRTRADEPPAQRQQLFVVHNMDLAPAADVFVVGIRGELSAVLHLQIKHFTVDTSLHAYKVGAELAKMGEMSLRAAAGHIAQSVRTPWKGGNLRTAVREHLTTAALIREHERQKTKQPDDTTTTGTSRSKSGIQRGEMMTSAAVYATLDALDVTWNGSSDRVGIFDAIMNGLKAAPLPATALKEGVDDACRLLVCFAAGRPTGGFEGYFDAPVALLVGEAEAAATLWPVHFGAAIDDTEMLLKQVLP